MCYINDPWKSPALIARIAILLYAVTSSGLSGPRSSYFVIQLVTLLINSIEHKNIDFLPLSARLKLIPAST